MDNNQKMKLEMRLASLGLSTASEFVPASRFKDDEWHREAINFSVTVMAHGRAVFTTPYAYGVGLLPGYQARIADKIAAESTMHAARELGRWPKRFDFDHLHAGSLPVPPPLVTDVLYSLVSDSDVLEHASFEDWADSYGCDTDSRKAESIYRECLKNALALRAAIGDAALQELRELFQDY